MIGRNEIMSFAEQSKLRPQVVEKDYVLGWILMGIGRDPILRKHWIFKGGTCLKKCFFENYRFSEDLDFTISDPSHIDEAFLKNRFSLLSEWLYEATGIELPIHKMGIRLWDTANGISAGDVKLSYAGPIAPNNNDLPRIKLDLTSDEILILPTVPRPIIFPYSDRPTGDLTVQCYDFSEIFAEKVRALTQRARPRDLYDVIQLFRSNEFNTSVQTVRNMIQKKFAFKGLAFPTRAAIEPHKDELFADWDRMLAHQMSPLPSAMYFWAELDHFFDWLNG